MYVIRGKNLSLAFFLFLLCLVLFSPMSFCQEKEASAKQVTLDAKMRSFVIEQVNTLLVKNYIFLETAEKMRDHLNTELKNGKYDDMEDAYNFARVLTKDLQSVSKDKHLRVAYNPELVQRIRASTSKSKEEREKERKERVKREEQQNFGFKKLELLEGNIGYLDLRYFSGLRESGETAVAAMNFLANSDAVIIDLRQNGGGNPSMIQLISTYFLKNYTHLNSFEWRGSDTLNQFWTLPYVPGKKMYDSYLYILTSRRTFSGAEEFTYNMKNLKRATIIGETTGGGAHPGGNRIVNDYFLVWIPSGRAINPITKTNWEGKGIEPHIPVPREEALDKAHSLALEELIKKADDEKEKFSLKWGLDGLKAKMEPVKVKEEVLKRYTGHYTRGEVMLDEGQLYFHAGSRKMKMIPVTEKYFIIEGESNIRAEFSLDASGKDYQIIGHFRDGRKDIVKRVKDKE